MSGDKCRSAAPVEPEISVSTATRPDHTASSIAAQEHVLADVSHELGNFFHKLYYWADYLQEKRPRRSADATATQMLEQTIRNLEQYLKAAVEYFHPVQLSCMAMPVPDVAAAVLAQVRGQLNGTPLTVSDLEPWQGATISIDPGRFSQALGVAMRRIVEQIGGETMVQIHIARGTCGGTPGLQILLELENPNAASPLFHAAAAGVEWAVAEKIVALHGGALSEAEPAPGRKSFGLFLPLAVA
jgi:hypothetical protein